jgi:hypothetical protein
MASIRARRCILGAVLAAVLSIGTTTAATTPAYAATKGPTRAYVSVTVTGPSSAIVKWRCRTSGWRPKGTIKINCKMSWGNTPLSNLNRTCKKTTFCYLPAHGYYQESVPLIPAGATVIATGHGPAGTTRGKASAGL